MELVSRSWINATCFPENTGLPFSKSLAPIRPCKRMHPSHDARCCKQNKMRPRSNNYFAPRTGDEARLSGTSPPSLSSLGDPNAWP